MALKTPDDLPAARDLVARHGGTSGLEDSPSWRLLVSPTSGTFTGTGAIVGETLTPGAPVGTVRTRREELAVVAVHGGTVVEWLVEDGDPVTPGQPLLRLHPQATTS